jgi:hypothetical protein
MRQLSRTICRPAVALASVLLLLVACASAGAAGLPGLFTGTGHGSQFVVRPAQIVYTGDGSGVLGGFSGHGPLPRFGRMTWSSWTSIQALGSGAVWLDDCMPNCAQGKFHPYTVTVHASDARAGHFTRLTLRYNFHGKQTIDRRALQKFGSSYAYSIVGTKPL